MGLKPRGRYSVYLTSAFEITRFSRTRIGGERFRGSQTGGGRGTPIQPSLFLLLFFNALQMEPCSCARDRRATRVDDQRQGRGAVVHPPRSDRVRAATSLLARRKFPPIAVDSATARGQPKPHYAKRREVHFELLRSGSTTAAIGDLPARSRGGRRTTLKVTRPAEFLFLTLR
jgi:hypothetical protein